jgi:hypothetical protein
VALGVDIAGVSGVGMAMGAEMVYLSAALVPLLIWYWTARAAWWMVEMVYPGRKRCAPTGMD